MRRSPLAIAMVACALSACSPSKLAYGQVKSALTDAGLSDKTASCMAIRMTDKLSLKQLVKLKQLKGANRSLGEFVDAVRKVGDAEALQVTASSAALCSTGLAG